MHWNKQTLQIETEVKAPLFFINQLQSQWINVSSEEVKSVIIWVNYDISRHLEFSEEWIYALNNVLNRVSSEKKKQKKKLKKVLLKIVK